MGVRVRQRPDRPGWWLFINHGGKQKKKCFTDKETALKVARKIRERLALGDLKITDDEQERKPFRSYFKAWLESYAKTHVKPSTYASYELAYQRHLLPFLGDIDIKEITREQLKRFMYEKLREGKQKRKCKDGEQKEGLSRNSVKNYLAPLREMFNHAIEDGHLDRNPCLGLMRNIRTEKGERLEKIGFLTREEVSLLLNACQKHFPSHSPFILLLVRTGLRLGEAVALQWGDLDFNSRFIEVRRTYSPIGRRYLTPKSGKVRRVDMSRQLTDTLKVFQVERKKETLKKGWGAVPLWVFTSEDGTMMDPDNFRSRVWGKLLDKAEFRRVRIHDLRHTFASLLIQQGESLAYIKEQMGHHSIQVTVDIYGHLVPGGNKAAVDRLDEPAPANPASPEPGLTQDGPTASLAHVAEQVETKKPLISQGLK